MRNGCEDRQDKKWQEMGLSEAGRGAELALLRTRRVPGGFISTRRILRLSWGCEADAMNRYNVRCVENRIGNLKKPIVFSTVIDSRAFRD